jgi:hypothetical protein
MQKLGKTLKKLLVKLGTSFVGCGGMTGPKQPKQKGKSFTTYIEGREQTEEAEM